MKDTSLKTFAQELLQLMPSLIRGMLRRQTDEIARGRITMPQYLVLDLIHTRGALRMTELALEMDVSMPAMTGIIQRMHGMGLVERSYDKRDRRIIRINVTAKGRQVVLKVGSQRLKAIEKTFGKLTATERKTYIGLLRKVYHGMYK